MDSVSPLINQLTANRERIFRYAFILQFIAAIPFLWLAYATGKTQATLLLRSKTAPGTVVAVIPFLAIQNVGFRRPVFRGTSIRRDCRI